MKKKVETAFDILFKSITVVEKEKIDQLFRRIDKQILIDKQAKSKLITDYEKALLYYDDNNLFIDESLRRLNLSKLNGLYTRASRYWYPLDNSAKIYPLTMKHGQMAVFRLSATLNEKVVPEIFQMALTFVMKRFPSFSTVVKKRSFGIT